MKTAIGKFLLLLEDSTNAFLNENWKAASDAFNPLIKKTIEDTTVEVLNKAFNFVPAKYIISDINELSNG